MIQSGAVLRYVQPQSKSGLTLRKTSVLGYGKPLANEAYRQTASDDDDIRRSVQ